MKAIIIETGETIDFKGSSTEFGDMTWIDSDGVLHQGHIKGGVKILEQGKEIDWEERRYQIAKDVLCATLSNIGIAHIDNVMEITDSLVDRLKKE